MRASEFAISAAPAAEQARSLEDRIHEFDAATGIAGGECLSILVKDAEERIVAGICGAVWGGCLEIRQFRVEETRRRQKLVPGRSPQRSRRRAGGTANGFCSARPPSGSRPSTPNMVSRSWPWWTTTRAASEPAHAQAPWRFRLGAPRSVPRGSGSRGPSIEAASGGT
ncbi:hypothetical protein MBSD_n1932 [Mizugakiibacter sediminis]|uniref:Uncharacterized protein n=1 Tax=Mizugakiibacter sediminis TaxID=1475481 RepID=A0A0K8QPJ8_9GAMM|nr:hypothetical protein [Mizugakiibacter sediminis]GAP66621.1 hypothetical protein MBSD_n1932 [Mizugakiibacter sediminis]